MRLLCVLLIGLAACEPSTSHNEPQSEAIEPIVLQEDSMQGLDTTFDEPPKGAAMDCLAASVPALNDRLDDIAGLFLKETGATFHGLRDTYPMQRDSIKGKHPIYWVAVYDPPTLGKFYLNRDSPASREAGPLSSSAQEEFERLLQAAKGVRGLLFTQTRGRTYPDQHVDAWHFQNREQAAAFQALLKDHTRQIFPKTMPLYSLKNEVLYVFHSGNMAACWSMKPIHEIFNENY